MNKLHNFLFVGEFPMFDSPEDCGSGSFLDAKNNYKALAQEIYLKPFDYNKAYNDVSENFSDTIMYNMRFLEGQEQGILLDEIDFDNMNTELIFLDDFDKELQSALSDISLQDIFLDPQIMNINDRREKTSSSDFLFPENDNVINLYYRNEKPVKENRKMKASMAFEREKYHCKKRRTI